MQYTATSLTPLHKTAPPLRPVRHIGSQQVG